MVGVQLRLGPRCGDQETDALRARRNLRLGGVEWAIEVDCSLKLLSIEDGGPREREVRVIVIERLGGTRPSSLSTLVSKSCSLPSLDSGISGEHLLSGHVFRGRRDPNEAGDRCVRSGPLNPQNWPEITFSEFRGADE